MAKRKSFGKASEGILGKAISQKQNSESSIKENIQIYPELKILIPPLIQEERDLLTESLKSEGCREALILWEKQENDVKEYILVDGHNRYEICQENEIPFKVELKEFASIQEVKDWMIVNQLGKRNITEETKSYLRGLKYQQEKKQGKRSDLTSGQNDQKLNTQEQLAEIYKVSPKTIQRDGKYAQAINIIAGENQDLKWKILNRELGLTKKNVLEFAEESEDTLEEIRVNLIQNNTLPKKEKLKKSDAPNKKLKPSQQEKFTQIVQELKQQGITHFELLEWIKEVYGD